MQYVLMIASRKLTFPDLVRSAPDMLVQLTDSDPDNFVFVRIHPSLNVRIEHMGRDLSDWADEPQHLEMISALGDAAEVYAVHFVQAQALREVLYRVATIPNLLIDDDFDMFVDGAEFRRLCDDNPGTNGWWLGGEHAN
ncbi:hypothetical protein [Sphingomonas sp. 22176]|uniref:hypothetical protein n=1 Tax=Sphingomonas sp. 22176 TaxID=3453884 RepID=UPI003F8587BA